MDVTEEEGWRVGFRLSLEHRPTERLKMGSAWTSARRIAMAGCIASRSLHIFLLTRGRPGCRCFSGNFSSRFPRRIFYGMALIFTFSPRFLQTRIFLPPPQQTHFTDDADNNTSTLARNTRLETQYVFGPKSRATSFNTPTRLSDSPQEIFGLARVIWNWFKT